MPSEIEIRSNHKSVLHDLLTLKKANDRAGIKVKSLNALIERRKAVMQEEDIALIERMVAESETDD